MDERTPRLVTRRTGLTVKRLFARVGGRALLQNNARTRLPASRSAACAPDRRRLTATRLQKHAGCGPGRLGRRARRRRAAATREAAARGGALPPRLRAAQRGCAHRCASCGTPAPSRRVPSTKRDAVCWACAAGSVPLRDTRTAAAPQCAAHFEPQTRSTPQPSHAAAATCGGPAPGFSARVRPGWSRIARLTSGALHPRIFTGCRLRSPGGREGRSRRRARIRRRRLARCARLARHRARAV